VICASSATICASASVIVALASEIFVAEGVDVAFSSIITNSALNLL
jgi:hypothetical protein